MANVSPKRRAIRIGAADRIARQAVCPKGIGLPPKNTRSELIEDFGNSM